MPTVSVPVRTGAYRPRSATAVDRKRPRRARATAGHSVTASGGLGPSPAARAAAVTVTVTVTVTETVPGSDCGTRRGGPTPASHAVTVRGNRDSWANIRVCQWNLGRLGSLLYSTFFGYISPWLYSTSQTAI